MRGGHQDAFCTSVNEEGHKHFNKMAAKFARKYASFNQTQDGMLDWVNRDKIWEEAGRLANCPSPDVSPSPLTTESDTAAAADMVQRMGVPLAYTNNWSSGVRYTIRAGRPSRWGATLLSSKVRVTRHELLTLVCTRLDIPTPKESAPKWADIARVLTHLQLRCYGTLTTAHPARTFVGISPTQPRRRDFVRICGTDKGKTTCLSAQLLMFVKISGFTNDELDGGIRLPENLRNPKLKDQHTAVWALVRWLSPHPDALLRDKKMRPICPSPFDMNHALWKFTNLDSSRSSFPEFLPSRITGGKAIHEQLDMFDGSDLHARLACMQNEAFARYDLLQPESFQTFMNCTRVNQDQSSILETITIPFHDTSDSKFNFS